MTTNKIAVVTGGNKGIGYAIVKGLCEKFNGDVYLTARDIQRGEIAAQRLKSDGLNPLLRQLDITDPESVNKFKVYIANTHGGIDLLVNNAAIAYKHNATEPFGEQAKVTVDVNFFGLQRVCDALFPILKPHARVVNLSSSAGHLSRIPSEKLKSKFKNPTLTIEELNELMKEFVVAAKGDGYIEEWGNSAYVVSKVGVSALTFIQQRNFDQEEPSRQIVVNCVHPGYVDTDMTSHKGPLTIEDGARAPLFLCLEPHDIKGQYVWCNSSVVDWSAPNTPAPV